MVSQRVLCRRFIGRVAEFDHVASCRRKAGAAHGGGVIVLGDAGIGKSRLVREYRERYANQTLIATGVCREFGQSPLDPLVEMFRQLSRGVPGPLAAPAASKEEQVARILAAVERATVRRVTTIIVEDIHWAQIELLHMLTALVQWAGNRRLLVICTCREGEAVPGTARYTALARLSREVSAVRLEPMAPVELSELMLDALDELGTRLPSETFNDVRRRAEGNPFFAEELLRHAVDAQHGAGPARTVRGLPISLQGVIRERLDRCDARERAFLSAAAVLGQRFRVDVLTDVFGIAREDAVAALGTLIELQLIDRSDDPLTYEFRHALARDVVYGDLVPAQAVALHERVAEAVESRPGADEHAELLAHSFWSAGMRDRAAPYCEAAGDRAMAHYAYEDAVTWFERAASSLGDRGSDVGRVLGKASIALNRLGEPKRAVPLYERAIDAYVAGGDFEAAVRMCTYLGGTLYNDARTGDAFAAFETAAALAARSGFAALELHVQLRLFSLCVASRNVDRASAIAAAIDENALDPKSRDTFEYELAKTTLYALRDERELRRASIDRAFAPLDRAASYERRFAHGYVAVDSLAIGEIAEAGRHARLGLEVARSIRSDVAYMLALLADAEERAGELRLAREHLAAIVPSTDFLHRHARTVAAVRVALAGGDDAPLAEAYDVGLLREAERGGNTDATLELVGAFAVAAAHLSRDVEARTLAERFTAELTSPFGLAWQIVEIARLFANLAPRMHEVLVADRAARPIEAAVTAFLEATVARDRHDAERARECGSAAAAAFERMGWPAMRARSLEAAGDLDGALRLYREIERSSDVRRLEDAAQREGIGTLSPREREVARLVASGMNNRTVAFEIAVTPKAVEKCLTSIYRKLGLSSRSQLAAYVSAQGIE
jgi:DNA-binding CsgD family transcriptional regulator/tetratricopeptide (TPR) repeat protein